ncbi:MAG TPA: hypothetical protein VHW23_05940 [Kofleriaceae bacterium]|jgi:hypothetical protein|nr:hypothetical protein [Kofleriaceae bacterium]
MPHVQLVRLLPRLVPALLLLACQTGPYNGTTVSGSVIGKSFLFQGYWNEPGEVISVQVMKDPAKDPSVAANWVQFATATSSTTPSMINSTDPLYYWSVNAAPVPTAAAAARWPQGGLVRVRAFHDDANGGHVLTTFDDVTFTDCLGEQLDVNADWATIGTKCAGIGGVAIVSTSNIPVAAGTAASFGGFLGKKGTITPVDTINYYLATGAPASLAAFKSTFGFPTGEVTATYYNDGDLGLGREMHCRAIGPGVACYVTNYSGVAGKAVFGQPVATVLADAVARQHSFATVAMTYSGIPGPNAVKFVVYDASGNWAFQAQLDSTANNTSIPNNCLACHGINSSYDPSTMTVSADAKFLPFDPFSYQFSTASGFTFADQADKFRRLNALVRQANPSPAIAQLIDGMYAPKAVTDSTAVASDDFVPDAWANENGSLAGTAMYRGVVKVGCRSCHSSAINSALDFNSPDDFSTFISAIRNDVCGSTHIMPHAEHVMKRFWQSGARAYLTAAYGPATYPDPLQVCKP